MTSVETPTTDAVENAIELKEVEGLS